jgi:hypothetical protein
MSALSEIGASIAATMGALAEAATFTQNGTDHACTAIIENADRSAQNMLVDDERVVIVFGLTVEPKQRDVLVIGTKRLGVQRSASAAMGSAWRIIAKE